MRRGAVFAASILLLFFLGGCPCHQMIPRTGQVDSDLVVFNANVFTSDAGDTRANAVAVKDGRFVFVGGDDGVLNYVGPNTRVVDARSGMVTPGFIDSHSHVVWLGMLNAVMTFLYDAKNLDDVKSSIREFAASHPELPFVMGIGWKYDYIPGGLPDAGMADDIIDDRPLFLWSHDGHTGWVNTPALKRMQAANPDAFRRLTPVFNEAGEPTGQFLHFYAINPFDYYTLEQAGANTINAMAEKLKALLDQGLSVGVTTHQDVMIHKPVFELLLRMSERGCFDKARMRGCYFLDHHSMENEQQLRDNLELWKQYASLSNPHMILGESIKLGMDGVGANHTAFMMEQYNNAPGNFGIASWSQDDFDTITRIADEKRLQICTHAVGDAAINRVLNSYERLDGLRDVWDARHTIEHCSLPIAGDIQRMSTMGVYASMQPTHVFGDQTIEDSLGEERLDRIFPWRSMHNAGVKIAFGTDYSIAPLNPLYGLLLAALRMNHNGEFDWGPQETISIEEAIRDYTIGSAEAMKMDKDIGSIEVGKLADFVLFNTDLTQMDSLPFLFTHNISIGGLDNMVVMTAVNGRIVYYNQQAEPCSEIIGGP